MQVPRTLYILCVLNPQFKLIYIGPAELPLNVISFYNLNVEISKGRGLMVKIYKSYYAGIIP